MAVILVTACVRGLGAGRANKGTLPRIRQRWTAAETNSAGSVQGSVQVFELATWHGRGDLDNGPSKSAADAAESGSGGYQVDSQEMGGSGSFMGGKTWEHNWGALHATKSWKHGIMGER